MEGYLRLRINPWIRRLLTGLLAIVPALIDLCLARKGRGSLLILSQVILSLQLGFAVIPLIHFVSDKKTMEVSYYQASCASAAAGSSRRRA